MMTMIALAFTRRGMMTTIGKKHKQESAALNGLRFLRLVEPRIALCAVCCEKQGKYPNKDIFALSAVFERVLKCDG